MLGFAREGGYHFLATIDADGQFDPGHLPVLAAPVLSGSFDFATASRFADPSLTPRMPRLKRMGNRWVAGLVSRLSRISVKDATCGFRFYGPRALDRVSCLSRFTYTQEVVIDLAMKGMRISEVPLSIRGERAVGVDRCQEVVPSLTGEAQHRAEGVAKPHVPAVGDDVRSRCPGNIRCAVG